ncbi:MAG: hypothetical protein ABFS19_12520 [Thermodesulfobacteriota bacterium]
MNSLTGLQMSGIGIFLAVLAVLYFTSEKLRKHVKKATFSIVVIIVVSVGYYLITGKTVLEIPGQINRTLSKRPGSSESTNPSYYQSVEKRYGFDPAKEEK